MRLLLTLLLCVSLPVLAQNSEDETAAPPPLCSAGKFRQFDFWIGDWNVTSDGQPAGTNSIHSIHNGCALMENWQGAGVGGISGSSFNIYDQANDRWHQTWVDSSGTLLQLDGGWDKDHMVLQGKRPAADGKGVTTHRITWTPNDDGTVRQLWEASQDGQTWTVLFDGLYLKDTISK
jgi:hypothetical protein